MRIYEFAVYKHIDNPNLALYRPAAASSESASGPAVDAVDGDPATSWRPGSTDITLDDRAWITVDLGVSKTFRRFYVKNGSNGTTNINQFRLAVSNDNSVWNDVYTSSGPIMSTNTYLFPAATGRYVRLNVEYAVKEAVRIYEFAVYENEEDPIVRGAEAIANARKSLTDEVDSRLHQTVALYSNSPFALVDGMKVTPFAQGEPPYWENATGGMGAVCFIAESIDSLAGCDRVGSQLTLDVDGKIIALSVGSDFIEVNGHGWTMAAPAQSVSDTVYAPVGDLAIAFGKELFRDDRGIAVLGDTANLFDSQDDKKLVDEIFNRFVLKRPDADQIIADFNRTTASYAHPRLMISPAIVSQYQGLVTTDTYFAQIYTPVLLEANQLLSAPPTSYTNQKRSTVFARDVQTLAMMYQITGDDRYAERAWQELEAFSEYETYTNDYLQLGYYAKSFAIGYDWLYDYLNETQRKTARDVLTNVLLKRALESYRNPTSQWVLGNSNWNTTINAGMSMGALAIFDEAPELAAEVLEAALRSIEDYIHEFAPDGAWPEGVYYWTFTLNSLVQHISSLESALGTHYGMLDIPGVLDTGSFGLYMTGANTGPSSYFNFHDAEGNRSNRSYNLDSSFFWFAAKQQNPFMAGLRLKEIVQNRVTPSVDDLVWYNPDYVSLVALDDVPLDRYFRETEVASFRTSWNDPDALHVAVHAGNNAGSHRNLDVGTYVVDALGERWAEDLGLDDYGLPGYFNREPGQRWTYYRNRAEGQNVLVMNPDGTPDQDPLAFGRIVEYLSEPDRGYAIVDMATAYDAHVDSARRGIALMDDRTKILIQDEVEMTAAGELWWFMHTKANIELQSDGQSAILQIGEKRVWVGIASPTSATMIAMDARPLPASPDPAGQNMNSGIRKLAIHLTGVTDATIAVFIVPLAGSATTPGVLPAIEPLSDW
ncbi:MAG: type protein [Paenibacillus sp.]|nr:type protein [Paenibacillus sp.]